MQTVAACVMSMKRRDALFELEHRRIAEHFATRKTKTPQSLDSAGFSPPSLAETEGFEPSIQVLAQMLP